MELNELMKNYIEDTLKRKPIKNCLVCNTPLKKVENTFRGIPVLTVHYCPRCGWTADNNEIKL